MKLILISVFLLGCGSNITPRIAPMNDVSGLKIEAQFVNDINDNPFTIPAISTKPRIFIFASELCGTCQAEHRALRDVMAAKTNVLPNNVDIYTIMVGAVDNLDSTGFKSITGMQWDPYYQVGDEFRNKLCGQGTPNPCVVVELPTSGVVLKKTGEVPASELEKLTGVWTW